MIAKLNTFIKIENLAYKLLILAMPVYMMYNFIYYYRIRIANSDDCFPFYNIIEHNVIDMLHYRILQGLFSIPPIILNVLGFDIKSIAVCYAFVYSVPIFITMFILYRSSSRYYLYFLLSFTFFISYQYYFFISEYWFGSCIYFILYMLLGLKPNWASNNKLIVIFIILNIVNLHLSLCYPTLIMLIYLFIRHKLDIKTTLLYLSVCSIYLVLKLAMFTTNYESNILTDSNNIINNLNFFHSRILKEFFNSSDWIYLASVMLFIIYSLMSNRYGVFKSVLLISFILIPLIVISIIFYDFPYFCYAIGNLRVLLLFLPILFVDFCPKKLYKPIVILLIIHAIFSIESIGITLKKRYDNIAELLTATKENTVYVYDDPVCLVHFKYIFMQTMTINLLENDKNNYISFINPKTDNIDYLKHDLVKYQSISKKEYKNRFTEYKMQKLSETRYAIYDFLIDRNVRECILDR